MAYKQVLQEYDCECGFKAFVLNREKSGEVKDWQIEILKNAAGEMSRQFIDSGETTKCPKCERAFDLAQTPAETYRDNGEKLFRVG